MLRVGGSQKREYFNSIQSRSSDNEKVGLRIVVWNVSHTPGHRLLPIIERNEPDLCFLQETPDGDLAIKPSDLTGYWDGFHWIDAGDCGVLSRFPIREIATRSVGPWSEPLLLDMEIPGNKKILLVNARLTLPTLLFNMFSSTQLAQFVKNHETRVEQYRLLSELIENSNYETVILAGDFNTPAAAFSLRPVRSILRDAWLECGHGWGRTITSSFPLSRIDQCWVSDDVECVYGRTYREGVSDHLMVFFEVTVPRHSGESRNPVSIGETDPGTKRRPD
ncbi:MAG: endonuclease/exonuclease/phosphatase family protein [bacterium]